MNAGHPGPDGGAGADHHAIVAHHSAGRPHRHEDNG